MIDIIYSDISNYIYIDISNNILNDLSNEINNECYICYENCNDISPCECINLYIHKKCLNDAILKLNNINCTICKKEYNNIVKATTYHYRISNHGYIILFNIISSFIFILIGLVELIIYYDNDNTNNNNLLLNQTIFIPFLSMGTTMLFIVLFYSYYMYIKYNLHICMRYEKTDIKFIY